MKVTVKPLIPYCDDISNSLNGKSSASPMFWNGCRGVKEKYVILIVKGKKIFLALLIFIFILFSLLEYSCFTLLCLFLLPSKADEPYVHICPLFLNFLSI